MSFSKRMCILALGAMAAVLLSSCGDTSSSGTAAAGKSEETEFSKISQDEFTRTLNLVDVSKDEFTGNYEIGMKNNDLTTIGNSLMGISMAILREDSKSEWYPDFIIAYAGTDWMFHDEFNLKSDAGILNLDIDSKMRDDQVQEGGYVSEISEYVPNDSEVSLFCKIVEGQDPKFRVRGSRGAVNELVGSFTNAAKVGNLQICTIYAGLKQGLKIPK